MKYHSTRNKQQTYSSAEALLKGIADDGGLFVPEMIPAIHFADWIDDSYQTIAEKIFSIYFSDLADQIPEVVRASYGANFDTKEIVPLFWPNEQTGFIELWHGPTLAFKDLALQCLPHLMQAAQQKLKDQQKILILTATSGDTGKAAMAGFANLEDFSVLVFYPYQGVSSFQKKQMLCPGGENVRAIAVRGNFDDCQRAVKNMFADPKLQTEISAENYRLSSANSINIGRLIPQMNYYIYSYLHSVKQGRIAYGEALNVTVPTGNFGNILAAAYTKEMGLPLGQIYLAANPNHVLADFLQTGVYDANRTLLKTSSPSMDILVASNLERYLYLRNPDCTWIQDLMQQLKTTGRFAVYKEILDIKADWADEQETADAIAELYRRDHYLIDPHTAVAYAVAGKQNMSHKQLIASTASPYKFADKILESLDISASANDWRKLQQIRALLETDLPQTIVQLFQEKEQTEWIAEQNTLNTIVPDWLLQK